MAPENTSRFGLDTPAYQAFMRGVNGQSFDDPALPVAWLAGAKLALDTGTPPPLTERNRADMAASICERRVA